MMEVMFIGPYAGTYLPECHTFALKGRTVFLPENLAMNLVGNNPKWWKFAESERISHGYS